MNHRSFIFAANALNMYSMNMFLHSRDLFKQSKSVCKLNGWNIQHVTVECSLEFLKNRGKIRVALILKLRHKAG